MPFIDHMAQRSTRRLPLAGTVCVRTDLRVVRGRLSNRGCLHNSFTPSPPMGNRRLCSCEIMCEIEACQLRCQQEISFKEVNTKEVERPRK